jgi:acetyl esterase/lipase
MKFSSFTILLLEAMLLLGLSGCAFKTVERSKNLKYTGAALASKKERRTLNVFAPKKRSSPSNVFLFVHGGNWNSGHKGLYNFFGNRMSRKEVVVVIIDYPLTPEANYNDMATAVAKAVIWVKKNIEGYGGNPDKIFVSGHSAGGHLASLVSLRNEYFDTLGTTNPITGTILIDAAGLDMHGYLTQKKPPEKHSYLKTFTRNPEEWKAASPLCHLHEGMPSMLIFLGEKTHSSIIKSHEKFVASLRDFEPNPRYHILKHRGHVSMISQFVKSRNPRYQEIIEFMNDH